MRLFPLVVAGVAALAVDAQAFQPWRPQVTIVAPDGQTVAFSDLTGPEPLVVNLWATWCGPCIEELPSLEALAGWLEPRGGRVVLVSVDQASAQDLNRYLERRLGLTELATYVDIAGDLERRYRVGFFPTTLILDGDGQVVDVIEGSADWASPAARQYLSRLFPGSDDAFRGVVSASAPGQRAWRSIPSR